MGLLLVGIYLIAVGYQGQAGNLILLLSQEGPFLPWAMAAGILAWIWRATPPPGRETVHIIIGSAVLGIILMQAAKIIAGVETVWTNLSNFGSGGSSIANTAIGLPTVSTTDGQVLAPGDGSTLDYNSIYPYATNAGFSPSQAATITAIALAESSGNPNAYNPNDPAGGSYGLTQINGIHVGASSALGNPQQSMNLAYTVSNGGTNFSPWSTFKNGSYQKYLQ